MLRPHSSDAALGGAPAANQTRVRSRSLAAGRPVARPRSRSRIRPRSISRCMSLPSEAIGATDRHGDRTRHLAEHPLGPQIARIMRHRQDRDAKRDREPRAAGLVVRARAGANARAFGVDDDPESLRKPLAPLRRDLRHRALARLAVDGDRRRATERPSEERDGKQLLLGDESERRADEIERQRLPGGRVLAHHHVRLGRRAEGSCGR